MHQHVFNDERTNTSARILQLAKLSFQTQGAIRQSLISKLDTTVAGQSVI